ncbi:MAG: mandelate racemase/muconate lactonizing enzyme family protein, partial [Kiloniellales bacterium]|nr:mandelate racemase/muconate lactonizing enzyme family protein [Kiloniellales bacterium]
MAIIEHIEARHFAIPLTEVLSDAMHGDHTHFELVTATVRLADGREGTGYTYTGGRGGHAVLAMIQYDLAPFLIGRDADPVEALHDAMQTHVHYVARGGIASFAISAVDIALWDLRGKSRGEPLWQMAGGAADRCRAYRGGIDLNFPLSKLLDSVSGYLEEGFDAVKIKVGRPDLAEDVERLAAVRALIGPARTLMADANYAMDVDQAVAACKAFRPFDLLWFEEPIVPDDFSGYGRI